MGDPHRRDEGRNRWDAEEFFDVGLESIGTLMRRAVEFDLPAGRERALDFGCGLGRLTQALAGYFAAVEGVDIAESMIDGAREHNRHGARVAYHLNTRDDLSLFEDDSFDLVCSYLVLQHIHPLYSLKYILEFVRMVRPGGLLAFELPSRVNPVQPLAPQAYRAEIRPDVTELRAAAGDKVALRVTVRNASPAHWPLRSDGRDLCIRLGNHWLDATGKLLAVDDGRVALPHDLAAGESADVELTVTAPKEPGLYAIELDLVQESTCWFAQRGSPTARVPIEVGPPLEPAPPAAQQASTGVLVPVMQMHRVAEEVVSGLLAAAGARLVAIDRTTCTYFATK